MGFTLTPKRKDQLGAVAIAFVTLFCMYKLVTYTPVDKSAETVGQAAVCVELTNTIQQQTNTITLQSQRLDNLEARVATQDRSIKKLYDYIFQLDVTAKETDSLPPIETP